MLEVPIRSPRRAKKCLASKHAWVRVTCKDDMKTAFSCSGKDGKCRPPCDRIFTVHQKSKHRIILSNEGVEVPTG